MQCTIKRSLKSIDSEFGWNFKKMSPPDSGHQTEQRLQIFRKFPIMPILYCVSEFHIGIFLSIETASMEGHKSYIYPASQFQILFCKIPEPHKGLVAMQVAPHGGQLCRFKSETKREVLKKTTPISPPPLHTFFEPLPNSC